MASSRNSVVILLFLGCCCFASSKNLPSYITPCKQSDPEFNKCYQKAIIDLKPHLKMGIPEMGLPPVDPLIIPEVKLQSGNGSSINLDLTLTNLNFTEGIHFEVPTIDMNIKTGQIYLEILYPHLKMISDYKAKGRILLIQLESEGKAHAEFDGVLLKGRFSSKQITKDGEEYLSINDKNMTVAAESIKLRLDNLFPNNQELTDNTNRLIQENIDVLLPELQPVIEETLSRLFVSFVEGVHNKFSINALYPK